MFGGCQYDAPWLIYHESQNGICRHTGLSTRGRTDLMETRGHVQKPKRGVVTKGCRFQAFESSLIGAACNMPHLGGQGPGKESFERPLGPYATQSPYNLRDSGRDAWQGNVAVDRGVLELPIIGRYIRIT